MKKLVLLAVALFGSVTLFAQVLTPPATVPATNSTQTPIATSGPTPVKINNAKLGILLSTDITENVSKSKALTRFYNLIEVAGLTETFKSKGPITLFAPGDGAFNKLSKGKLDTLLQPIHRPELIALITYHALAGQITSKDIAKQIRANKNLATFTTLSGSRLTAKIDDNRNIILIDENGGQSMISNFDMEQSNGMLFIIDTVLVPKNRLF